MKDARKIGVVGLGKVGTTAKHALEYCFECVGYDIVGEYSWERILETDCVMICVSTPAGKDGRLDCSNVEDVGTVAFSSDG